MRKMGRSKDTCLEELRIKLCFKAEIEENNLFLAAGLTYFFGVLFSYLTEVVERYFGIILILTAIMIIWYFMDKRKEILRKYRRQIELLLKSKEA